MEGEEVMAESVASIAKYLLWEMVDSFGALVDQQVIGQVKIYERWIKTGGSVQRRQMRPNGFDPASRFQYVSFVDRLINM